MFRVNRGGTGSQHGPTFHMSRPKGSPDYVALIFRSKARFEIYGQTSEVTPPTAVILPPDVAYSYDNPWGTFSDDWIHFEVEPGIYKDRIDAIAGKLIPVSNDELYTFLIQNILLEKLLRDNGQTSPYSEENIESLCVLLVNHLSAAVTEAQNAVNRFPYQDKMKLVRMQIANSVWKNHTIEEAARSLNISESYFQALYKEAFGMSFQQDLIHMRINHAKMLLVQRDMTVSEVADYCGYNSEVHFYRQFRKIVGCTPTQFRANANPSDYQVGMVPVSHETQYFDPSDSPYGMKREDDPDME